MCYDIKASLEAQLKRARRAADLNAIQEIEKKLVPLTDLPLFHASGFSHPKLLIYTDASPNIPVVANWGLVPHWVKDSVQLKKFWNNTLNARGETIFEKPAFRQSAKSNRCLVYIDGFYEHHHYKGKTYPYYIYQKDATPMILAGLWSEWVDRETGELWTTFSIVTTAGNPLLAKIHNNPKLKGPRMPLILPESLADKWLMNIEEELDIKLIQELIMSYPQEALDAHTVHRLRGKEYIGNVAHINEKVAYPELVE